MMLRRRNGSRLAFSVLALCGVAVVCEGNDWPAWRGPEANGMTRETAAVTSWSLDGENLLWRAAVRGRSTPIVMNGRVFVIAPVGSGECLGERVVGLDANTGKMLWEHRLNVFHTDIVENRLGWTAVVGDPETGNIYAHGTGGEFLCLNRDGKLLWSHSLTEEYGRSSGYGGRLQTPIIDEDRVVISIIYILTRWDTGKKKAGHLYLAFDKLTGELLWMSRPGGRPKNTTYSTPAVTVVGGKRMLVAGNADGSVYGMMARSGEKIWSCRVSKTGINSSIVAHGKYVYVAHSEENIKGTQMGSVLCLDASKSGDITDTGILWRHDGVEVGYASPALANGRLYVITNAANLIAYDAHTGKKYWEHRLGRVMKGSPVVTADGVIYATEVNGRFLILRDAGDQCKELSVTEFPKHGDLEVEVNGSPAVANGRVYFMNSFEMFCLAKQGAGDRIAAIPRMEMEAIPEAAARGVLRVVPPEVTLAPGERIDFETQLYDEHGLRLSMSPPQWSSKRLHGYFDGMGSFVAADENKFSTGVIHAQFGALAAEARVRISPKLPIYETFDGMTLGKQPPGWIGVDAKTKLVEKDGSVVLEKLALKPSAKYARMRSYSSPVLPAGYTVEVDMLGTPKKGRRPKLSDMGIINTRYNMILLGYEKRIRLVTYAPIPRLQKEVPFDWKADTWYRAKFRFELSDGKGLARAKVWPRDDAEPSGWMIEMTDPCPNTEGSPGLYVYSKGTTVSKPGAPVFFDNYRVYRNEK